jgi:hypothetical protein
MALDFGRFDDQVEQSLNDRFGTLFRRLIFCLGFVQIRGLRIRLMSNEKDRNFYENSQFLLPLNKVLRWIFALKSLKMVGNAYWASGIPSEGGAAIASL